MADDVCSSAERVAADAQDDLLQEMTRPVWKLPYVAKNCDASAKVAAHPHAKISPLMGVTTIARQHLAIDAQNDVDHYVLQLLTAESLQGDAAACAVRADVGDICIVDPAQASPSPVKAMSIAMSRPALEKAAGVRHLHGVVLKANAAMTPVIASLLCALCSLVAPLQEVQATAAQEAIIVLLSAALKDHRTSEVAIDTSALGAGCANASLNSSRATCRCWSCRRIFSATTSRYRAPISTALSPTMAAWRKCCAISGWMRPIGSSRNRCAARVRSPRLPTALVFPAAINCCGRFAVASA